MITSFTGPRWLVWAATALIVAGVVLLFVPGAVPAASRRAAIGVRPPVAGRWIALNSPASRTPSHGTHAYGQTYAIDLVSRARPGRPGRGLAGWPLARRPAALPASASRCSPRPTAAWSGSATGSATTGAGPPGWRWRYMLLVEAQPRAS